MDPISPTARSRLYCLQIDSVSHFNEAAQPAWLCKMEPGWGEGPSKWEWLCLIVWPFLRRSWPEPCSTFNYSQFLRQTLFNTCMTGVGNSGRSLGYSSGNSQNALHVLIHLSAPNGLECALTVSLAGLRNNLGKKHPYNEKKKKNITLAEKFNYWCAALITSYLTHTFRLRCKLQWGSFLLSKAMIVLCVIIMNVAINQKTPLHS